MKTILLGVLLGLLAVYPHLAAAAVPALSWLVGQPIVWAFAAGVVARPRIARRFPRSTP